MSAPSIEAVLEILTREAEIILSGRGAPFSPDASLASIGFDSLSFVELMVAVERHFNIRLLEMGMKTEDLRSLGSLARCIHHAVQP